MVIRDTSLKVSATAYRELQAAIARLREENTRLRARHTEAEVLRGNAQEEVRRLVEERELMLAESKRRFELLAAEEREVTRLRNALEVSVEATRLQREDHESENARLQREVERMTMYAQEVGAVLLEETGALQDMDTVVAATALSQKLIEHPDDAFVVHEMTLFTQEGDEESIPETYDLIIQKAGAETFSDNLQRCKEENARLREENASLHSKLAKANDESQELRNTNLELCAEKGRLRGENDWLRTDRAGWVKEHDRIRAELEGARMKESILRGRLSTIAEEADAAMKFASGHHDIRWDTVAEQADIDAIDAARGEGKVGENG